MYIYICIHPKCSMYGTCINGYTSCNADSCNWLWFVELAPSKGKESSRQYKSSWNKNKMLLTWDGVEFFFMFAWTMWTTASAGRKLVTSPCCGGPAMHFQSWMPCQRTVENTARLILVLRPGMIENRFPVICTLVSCICGSGYRWCKSSLQCFELFVTKIKVAQTRVSFDCGRWGPGLVVEFRARKGR